MRNTGECVGRLIQLSDKEYRAQLILQTSALRSSPLQDHLLPHRSFLSSAHHESLELTRSDQACNGQLV